ncbi:MAG: hypothetical protein ACRERC_10535 [Candidatus Binatia bacterium]
MSTVKGLRAGVIAGVLLGMTLAAGTVSAQGNFSTERPGSILIFPKVVNTNPNTIIQISNVSNNVVHAHCFYTDGRPVNGQPAWQVTDFEISLTRQQPTTWSASDGRAVNPQDGDRGFDPGLVPPVPPGFTGFLVCVETALDGTPMGSNSLTGQATIGDITTLGGTNNVSKYNAIGIPSCNGNGMAMGNPGLCGPTSGTNNLDNVLSLNGVEYAACPGGLYVNFIGDGAEDPAIALAGNSPSVVSTSLTFIPCAIDFENLEPEETAVTFAIRNEFEVNRSISPVLVDCWFESLIGDLGPPFVMTEAGLQTTFGKAIVTPIGPGLAPVLGVANVLRTAGDGSSDTAATNLHFCTDDADPPGCPSFNSEIRLP